MVDLSLPYVFFRVEQDGKALAVHSAGNIKDAKYWLTYVAQPGDAMFQTPAHPKYSGTGQPTYYAHLVKRGVVAYDEAKWREQVLGENVSLTLVWEPAQNSASA